MHPTVMGKSFEDVAPYNAAMNVCDKASQWQAWGGRSLGQGSCLTNWCLCVLKEVEVKM